MTMNASQLPLTGAQILARLEAIERQTASDVTGVMRPLNAPVGIQILAANSIQAARMAQGWAVPAGVNLANYTFAR